MILNARFHAGSGWGGALVRNWTRSKIGHCDLVFPDGMTLDIRPDCGVRLVHYSYIPDMDLIHQVPVAVTDAGLDCILAWLHGPDVLGASYDFFGAAAAGMPLLAREHDTKWFCSEALTRALQLGGALSHRVTPWRQAPHAAYELLPPS